MIKISNCKTVKYFSVSYFATKPSAKGEIANMKNTNGFISIAHNDNNTYITRNNAIEEV